MNTTECKNGNWNTIKYIIINIALYASNATKILCRQLNTKILNVKNTKYHGDVRTTDRTPTSDTFKVPNTWFAKSLMAAWHQRQRSSRCTTRHTSQSSVARQQSRWRSRRRRQRLFRRQMSRCLNPLVRHTDRSCLLPCCGSPLSEIRV